MIFGPLSVGNKKIKSATVQISPNTEESQFAVSLIEARTS